MEKNNSKSNLIITLIVLLALAGGVALAIYLGKSRSSGDDSREESSSKEVKSDDRKDDDKKEDDNKDDREISKEEAEKIATDKYGGEIKETEDDDYHGKPAWEVEIRNSKEGRIEVKVDKKTGEILDIEKD